MKNQVGKKKLQSQSLKTESDVEPQHWSIDRLLLSDFLVVCEDYVRGVENDISIIKTIDFIRPEFIPHTPRRFVVIATFFRFPNVSIELFRKLSPEFQLSIHTPTGKKVDVGPFPVSDLTEQDPWLIERLIVDLSESIEFTTSGAYRIAIEGRTNVSPFQRLQIRLLPVAEPIQIKRALTKV